MKILNKNTVRNYMLNDLERLLMCTNEDVRHYCDQEGLDIYDFIHKLDE